MRRERPSSGPKLQRRLGRRWSCGVLVLLGATLALFGAGCMSAPPEVAADLTPPDGRRPNHYALLPGADEPPKTAKRAFTPEPPASATRAGAGASR